MENQEQHVRQPQFAPTYERRQKTQVIENQGRHVRQYVYLPKGLQYDGTTNWESFLVKFNRYADVSRWTTTECKDQLCCGLQGKASEFYTTIVSRDCDIDYLEFIRKLEKRFNFVDLPETLQVKFMGAHQTATEKLEDWTDRLLSLAMKTFRDLPE